MSQLVSVAQYRTFTKDTSTFSHQVTAAVEDATSAWEDWLDRWLVNAEYTENVNTDKRGRVFPKAVPVTIPPTNFTNWAGGYELVGASVTFPPGFWPTWEDPLSVDITYTGGYEADNVPKIIANNIIKSAYKILHPDTTSPRGAKSVKLGDAAVTYESAITAFDTIDRTQEREMRPYRRKHL